LIKEFSILFTVCAVFGMGGCATLDQGGEKVVIVSNVDKDCKNLGPVNVTVTGFGLASESQNVLRNNAAEKGGNTLVQTGDDAGIAYYCPPNSNSR
jgi:hypothetical protein